MYLIEIYNNQTFLELKNKVSKEIKINANDLVLSGKKEYDYKYNSEQIKDIDGFCHGMTLYAIFKIGGWPII